MGKMIFEYSVMNSGKTLKLLQFNYNFNFNNIDTLVLKPALDTRDTKVSSRLGVSTECTNVKPDENIKEVLEKYNSENDKNVKSILVDESQFLTSKQVLELREIADTSDIVVMCFGLRTDFKGNLFEGSSTLMARADKILESKTICHCGKKATMVLKFDENKKVIKYGDSIDCGSEDKYISVCHKHWSENKIS